MTRSIPSQILFVFLALLPALISISRPATSDDWPQWGGTQHDGVWRETGIVKSLKGKEPNFKWRVPINKGYTGPAIANGKLFVMDRKEAVEEPEQKGGDSKEEKKSSTKKKQAGSTPGFPELPGSERILCLDAKTGKEIWNVEYDCTYKISYPEGPRTTPLVEGDRVYTLGAMGDLYCLDTETGKKIWYKNLLKEYGTKPPVWGYAAHLRTFGNKLITLAGGEGSAVVCLDKNDGTELWKSQTAKEVGYAPPVPLKVGGKTQLVYWSDVSVSGLALEDGNQKWTIQFPEVPPQRPIVTIMTPQVVGRKIMVSNFYNGSCVIEVNPEGTAATKIWSSDPKDRNHRTGLNILMGTPHVTSGHIYGFAGKGEMRCLELGTGKQLWEEKSPARADRASYFATAFITPNQDRFFIFNDQGELLIAKLSPNGFEEISRSEILEPATFVRGRKIVWSHPAYANRCLYARNSKELVCVDLSE